MADLSQPLEGVRYEKTGGVAILTLDRPERAGIDQREAERPAQRELVGDRGERGRQRGQRVVGLRLGLGQVRPHTGGIGILPTGVEGPASRGCAHGLGGRARGVGSPRAGGGRWRP